MESLLNNVKVTKVKDAQISAGTDVESDSVDMEGFEGVVFVCQIATVNAANFMKIQQSSDDASADPYADLLGTKQVPGDDLDQAKVDIVRPLERYLRAVIDRGGANTVTGAIYAIQYGARKVPIVNEDAEVHVSPAEGTA